MNRWTTCIVGTLLLAMSFGANAIVVFADFNSDMAGDTIVNTTPGTTLPLSVYVSQSVAEVATNGGLASFDLIIEALNSLTFLGANPAEKVSNTVIDPLWDGFPSATSLVGEQLQVGGNVLFNSPSTDPIVHLFDISVVVPNMIGTFNLSLADAPGPSFNAGLAIYDPTAVFQSTQINAVPLPAAVWLLGSALFGLFGLRRNRI